MSDEDPKTATLLARYRFADETKNVVVEGARALPRDLIIGQ